MSATPSLLWPLAARPRLNLPARCENGRRVWLVAGKPRVFIGQAGQTTIRCLSGEAWLTQSGDSRDLILRAGDIFACDRGGRIVAEGLTDSMLCVID